MRKNDPRRWVIIFLAGLAIAAVMAVYYSSAYIRRVLKRK